MISSRVVLPPGTIVRLTEKVLSNLLVGNSRSRKFFKIEGGLWRVVKFPVRMSGVASFEDPAGNTLQVVVRPLSVGMWRECSVQDGAVRLFDILRRRCVPRILSYRGVCFEYQAY